VGEQGNGNPNPAVRGDGGIGIDVRPTFGPSQPFYLPGPAAGYFGGGAGGGAGCFSGGAGGLGGGGAGGPAFNNGTAGSPASGGGGGGGSGTAPTNRNGGSGGGGVVAVIEKNGPLQAPGVWSLSEAYNFKKAGNWTS
jgi:hypothetical protein